MIIALLRFTAALWLIEPSIVLNVSINYILYTDFIVTFFIFLDRFLLLTRVIDFTGIVRKNIHTFKCLREQKC